MKLSDNFWLYEFTRSQTAIEQDIEEQFNPPQDIVDNLNLLAKDILQPLRTEFQARIFPTSGYRCERLNKAVKGSENSDHMRGMAADITCKNPEGLYNLAIALKLPYKQLIYYPNRNFVHISYDPNDIRRQAWTTFK
jgi:zinc D-Ala-D-Ala carboxypeptidase